MDLEGRWQEVLSNLLRKRDLLIEDDLRSTSIRPALLILPGVMRGIFGAGALAALEKRGLRHVFDVVVGISTGAPSGAYFLADQVETGMSILLEECASARFISLLSPGRFVSCRRCNEHTRCPVDTAYLGRIFRGQTSPAKALDQKKLAASRTAFYVGATCAQSGMGSFFDVKRSDDLVEPILASIAIPGLTNAVTIGGRPYIDGAGAYPLPVSEIMERFQPTDILILANGPKDEREYFIRRKLVSLFTIGHNEPVREVFRTRAERFDRELARLRQEKLSCRVAILWCDDMGIFERNPRRLKAARDSAQSYLEKKLAEAAAGAFELAFAAE